MSFKRFRSFILIPVFFIIVAGVFAYITSYLNRHVAIIELCSVAGMCMIYFVWLYFARRDFVQMVISVAAKVDFTKKKSLMSFPLPVVMTDGAGRVEFFNSMFCDLVSDARELEDCEITQFTQDVPLEVLLSQQGIDVECNEHHYSVYSSETKVRQKTYYVFYFIDDTQLKLTSEEYEKSRPVAVLIALDGVEEIQKNYSNNEFAEIRLGIDRIISDWTSEFSCIYHRLSSDDYVMVAQQRNLDSMKQARFAILSAVRNFAYDEKQVGFTLSIGIGTGDTLAECESGARQALDMSQSRGGDQAAIRNSDGTYEFFGGISKGLERRTKVKTRIMASSISEIIKASENVLIVGHRFADLDAAGAAVALCAAALYLGKPASIVMDKSKSLAGPLLDRMRAEGMGELITQPHEALQRAGKNTLLIVVDTHIIDFVEVPELLSRVKSVIVIDHHRKSVNFINNAVIFFHDQSASSASEMVTELLQYMSAKPIIGRLEADALLAGIMLDTRNFVLRSGVRTFEAAAYLKSRGADTVKVKKMFSSSLESYIRRNKIVTSSTMFRNCAISVADFASPDVRIISAQAADELLNISDVDASFVLFESGDVVNISARSLGTMNVQIIMETLGGGGHQTMAAAQLGAVTIDTAMARLHSAIDDYYNATNR